MSENVTAAEQIVRINADLNLGGYGEDNGFLTRKKVFFSGDSEDLGRFINNTLDRNPNLTSLTVEVESNCKWEDPVHLKHGGMHLTIIAKSYQHKYISEKSGDSEKAKKEDMDRCPVTIEFQNSRLVYPSREEGDHYYGYLTFSALIVHGEYSSVTIRGLTLRDNNIVNPEMSIYEQGLLMIGSDSKISIIDCRVELSQRSLVTIYSASSSHLNFGHVRIVKNEESQQTVVYPVIPIKEQSWRGNRAIVSRTDNILGNGVEWVQQEQIQEHIQYLS